MDDAIIRRHHAVICQSEFGSILFECIHLRLRYKILNGFILIVGRRVMIGHTVYLLRTEALQSSGPHAFKGLGRCHLVAVQAVDIQLLWTIFHLLHHMCIPYFIK